MNIVTKLFKKYSLQVKSKEYNEKKITNNSLNLSNEIQYDICWWNKSFAVEWWTKNGHFNDTLYRHYLSAKIDKQEERITMN